MKKIFSLLLAGIMTVGMMMPVAALEQEDWENGKYVVPNEPMLGSLRVTQNGTTSGEAIVDYSLFLDMRRKIDGCTPCVTHCNRLVLVCNR